MPRSSFEAPALQRDERVRADISPKLLALWNPDIRAATEDDDKAISILDVIGSDWWDEGTTAKRIGAALRKIGPGPVTVNINSPGGDYFEGLAIYNTLRQHDGEITVNVLGMAASAASIIAMAADTLRVARAGFLMIHNTWTMAVGNRHDLIAVADVLKDFDQVAAELYAARSGQQESVIAQMMDEETYLSGTKAVEMSLADALLDSDSVSEAEKSARAAAHTMDVALAKAGLTRSERRKLFNQFKSGKPSAAGAGTRPAAGDKPRAVTIKAEPLSISFPRIF